MNDIGGLKRHNNPFFWVITGIFLGTTAPLVGVLEGRLFPAASKMTLHSAVIDSFLDTVNKEPRKRVIFSGEAERLRPGCSPVRMEWHVGERDSQAVLAPFKWGAPTLNPNDVFTFTGWSVVLRFEDTLEYFKEKTHADVVHQCRIFYSLDEEGRAVGGINLPWLTYTEFWN